MFQINEREHLPSEQRGHRLRCYRAGMGSKGDKPRNPKHSQHLPKVGSAIENERLLHEEREAVLGQMGMRNAPSGVKIAITAVVVILIVAAILALLLIVFR